MKITLSLNILKIMLLLCIPFQTLAQDDALNRQVMRSHANGKDHVVLYFDAKTNELAKEEVFFASGKLEWSGYYKKNLESGLWKFYYSNGNLKVQETYLNGKEHGVSTEYDENGKKVKESYWKNGKLLKELTY
jgi:antitoxin component YwqK of YwqJK toxin-antitoxin module